MTDRNHVLSYQDLFHQQSQDFLALAHLQRVCPCPQPGTEIGERFDQAQALGMVGGGRFQCVQFGLHRLLLLAEFRHPAAKLLQAYQTFLIGVQQTIHALLQPRVLPA
jgi:hypothetical protein